MKRYFCTVAAGLVLALTSTATASADIGLPLPGQSGTQEAFLGDQTVGEQKNTADVEQKQGNGNINISPAIGILGGAETTNSQGNGNYAESDVDQENEVEQSQDSTQKQDATQDGCCDGQSQTGEQKTSFGDQTVGEQKNEATVSQEQGNGNINISPAIAILGNAETTNSQGNGNVAKSDVDQKNEVEQDQESEQHQSLEQSGSGGNCCGGQSQTGEQTTYGGDQTVGEQKNTADVEQKQGNGNINISPAIAILGNAETTNSQGNGNVAKSDVDQKNEVEQSQDSTQKQELSQQGGSCCTPKHGYGEKGCCERGSSQTGEQKSSFGDQTVGEQKNEATVSQKQGNDNVNISPAIAIGGGKNGSCYSKCETSRHPLGGGAETTNHQGNGNYAESDIDQKNEVEQSQDSMQKQDLSQHGARCCEPRPSCTSSYGCEPKKEYGNKTCCEHGRNQTGEQKVYFGDQTVGEQKNTADATQKQGNDNENVALPIAVLGSAGTTNSQGNGNVAKSDVDQKNDVEQKQESMQKQELTQNGGHCCKPAPDPCKTSHGCQPKKEYDRKPSPSCSQKCEPQKDFGKKSYPREQCCEHGRDQTVEQKARFGDQTVGEQKNTADVTQKQGNDNVAFSPAAGFGGGLRGDSCGSTCGKSRYPSSHGAVTRNKQGNGNYASSDVDQKNQVEQKQSAYQRQDLVEMCKGLVYR
jgi:hypothetical protein